jgi:AcrR family transcriptional regulator
VRRRSKFNVAVLTTLMISVLLSNTVPTRAMASSKSSGPLRAERLRERSAARRDTERRQLREAILETASAQLIEQGYEKFSLREVAERTGYAPTTIYRCFRDRDDLLANVLGDAFARFARALRSAAGGHQSGREFLVAQAGAYIDFVMQNPMLYRVMFMDRSDIGMHENVSLRDDPAFSVLIEGVELLAVEGNLGSRTVLDGALTLWATVHGFAALLVATPILKDADVRALACTAADAQIRGMART